VAQELGQGLRIYTLEQVDVQRCLALHFQEIWHGFLNLNDAIDGDGDSDDDNNNDDDDENECEGNLEEDVKGNN
jgi:hypothetical protein